MISVSRLPRSQHCARLSAGATDGNPTQKLAAFVIERPRRHRDAKPTRPAGRNSELGQPHRRDRTDFSHARRSRRICCRAVHRRDTIDELQLHLGEPSVDGAIERTLTCQIRPLGVRGPYTAKRAAALGEHRTAVEHDDVPHPSKKTRRSTARHRLTGSHLTYASPPIFTASATTEGRRNSESCPTAAWLGPFHASPPRP